MSEFTEIESIFSNISQYFSDVNNYLLSGGTPPELTGVLANLEYPELLTFVDSLAESGAGYSIGAAQEAIHTAVAASREIFISGLRKSELYVTCAGDAAEEATFYNQSGSFYAGVVAGSPTNGSQC